MKTSHLFAAAALAVIAVTAAQAETYDGVQAPVSAKSRADVEAQAIATANAKDQNVVRGSRGAETVAVSRDRSGVEAEAIRAAAAPDQNVSSGSRVNSKVISTMPNPVDARAEAAKQNASKL
jgi:long-subunit acyl-CoA synthetase (AMP-forming)